MFTARNLQNTTKKDKILQQFHGLPLGCWLWLGKPLQAPFKIKAIPFFGLGTRKLETKALNQLTRHWICIFSMRFGCETSNDPSDPKICCYMLFNLSIRLPTLPTLPMHPSKKPAKQRVSASIYTASGYPSRIYGPFRTADRSFVLITPHECWSRISDIGLLQTHLKHDKKTLVRKNLCKYEQY